MAAERILAVTGGASGIGLAVAEAALAEGGWHVAVADRDAAALAAAEERLDADRAAFAALDVTEEAAVEAWIAGLSGEGRLLGLVTAAGIAADMPALNTPAALFRRILEVNATGTFLCARAAGRAMRDHGGGGAIVTIASVSGLRGGKGRVAYGASKAAVVNMSQVLAVDLAPFGIRVNALCPGPVDTPLVARMQGPADRAQRRRQLPMRRYGRLEEIAAMVLVLLDEARSSYVMGQAIAVDGGFAGAGIMPAMD